MKRPQGREITTTSEGATRMSTTIPFSPPDIGDAEVAAVTRVMKSGWITTGPEVASFESEIAEYVDVDSAIALSSATAALEMILRCLGIGPGDEVITSVYTYSASASAIAHVGATPILVDVVPGSYAISPEGISQAITARTKAVIPVDIGGVMCDYPAIIDVVLQQRQQFRPRNELQQALGRIAVIADAAHSLGARRDGVHSGSAADFTAFSFHAVKNLTTAEGGAATWRRDLPGAEGIYRKLRLLALHGQTKDAFAKTAGNWEYDIVTLGYKANMTDIAAAIGRVQLGRYEEMIVRRQYLAGRYDRLLEGRNCTSLVHRDDHHRSSAHLYMLQLGGRGRVFRDNLILALAERGISSNVHFKPLPLFTAYAALGFKAKDYPHAIQQFENELSLPMYSLLSDDQLDRVATTLIELGI